MIFGLFRSYDKDQRIKELEKTVQSLLASEFVKDIRIGELELRLSISEEERNARGAALQLVEDRNRSINYSLQSATDAIQIFANRYKISAAELRQLHVADMVIHEAGEDGRNKREVEAVFRNTDDSDPLTALNDGNDFKQTAGKFRQLRQHFVTLQLALTSMFDALEKHASEKPLTKEQVATYRLGASSMIRRKI